MKIKLSLGLSAVLLCGATYTHAAETTFTNQVDFEAALPESFKLIDLESQLSANNVNDFDLTGFGATFFGPNATIRSGDNGQTEGDHDRIILNGAGFNPNFPSIGLNFSQDFDGVGAFSNFIDGGRIRLFSEINGQGDLIGEVGFGGGNAGGGNFGGITTDQSFQSAVITCEFNSDLKCGVFDIQFGMFNMPTKSVPEPSILLGLFSLGTVAFGMRKQRKKENITTFLNQSK